MIGRSKAPRRVLFLDDDPARGEAFLAGNPGADWVKTVPDCLAKLAEADGWAEVHLDHDLGGEVYVDSARDDCGMEVVRWLAKEPRPHLRRARFVVHSHNMTGALTMVQEIRALGFPVEARPFGLEPPEDPSSPWIKLRELARRLRGLPPEGQGTASGVDPDAMP